MRDLRIEISTQEVSYRNEDGEWLDGDYRALTDRDTTTLDFEHTDAEHTSALTWAIETIGETGVTEASLSPITGVRESDWLAGSYQNPYTGDYTETVVRLLGEWTTQERTAVFQQSVR